ncbi:hypothetical protein Bhyg_02401, partial [Pseudolycoriella hygida]|jgi:hypothetical protein
MISS